MIFLVTLPGSRSCLLVRFLDFWCLSCSYCGASLKFKVTWYLYHWNWPRLEISSDNPKSSWCYLLVHPSAPFLPHSTLICPGFSTVPILNGLMNSFSISPPVHPDTSSPVPYRLTTCGTACHSSQYLYSGLKPFLKMHSLIQSGYHRFPRPKPEKVISDYYDKTLWPRLLIKERVIWGLEVRGVRVHKDVDNMTTDGRHGGWSWKLRAEPLSYWATIREQREQIRVVQVFKLVNSPPETFDI